ncbi:hypothetical protein ACIBEJ_33700 [Nonomuraea sp. NPDC050790]|uniref:hypothetical protein n=1 Tax=Nonomuraea sp. NPDC050790 TaxID=3364371 RepID=UPI00378F7D3C
MSGPCRGIGARYPVAEWNRKSVWRFTFVSNPAVSGDADRIGGCTFLPEIQLGHGDDGYRYPLVANSERQL